MLSCPRFSIALDGDTVLAKFYIDLCVRFYNMIKLHNYRVLAIPIRERHTGEKMFNLIVNLLNSRCCEAWKVKLIEVSTDGAAKIVGRLSGVVTRIQNVCT